MPISKRYLDEQTESVSFDVQALGHALEENCPEAIFGYLMGSSASGTVGPHSDVDIALFVSGATGLDFYKKVHDTCRLIFGDIRVDLGLLNNAEPVYRFESLKGRLLFCRDQEKWLRFYSVACREYEHQLFHYEKQHRYRLEAKNAV